jgi:RNA polymerase sigma-70 factor (sigma-E family)
VNRHDSEERDADFTAFVEANGPRLLHTARLLTGDPHRAADLVQSSLERAYTHWGRIRGDDPYAYVRRIVVNQNHDWWRRGHGREQPTAELPPDGSAARDLAEEYARREQVRGLLGVLTSRERTVVVLRYHLDLGEATIAAELGIAVGTVKSTLARALAKLRAHPGLDPRVGRPESVHARSGPELPTGEARP